MNNKPHSKDDTRQKLQENFGVYTTANLVGLSAEDFYTSLKSRIDTIDPEIEGFSDEELEQQRDLSIKYHWGHDHDFGDFKLEGRMGSRHLDLLVNFTDLFPIETDDFSGSKVFDVGCWTGGTSLLLATLAKEVVAIEEVKKYADTVAFLSSSFGIAEKVSAEALSIYECNTEKFYGAFDIAYFPGVIYHLSDPVLALRILFNSLKDGGCILVESAGLDSEEPVCRFEGNNIYHSNYRPSAAESREELNRGGWNWFLPSPVALKRMMEEAGFEDVLSLWHGKSKRIYAYGKKSAYKGICKAGLSVKDIR